MDAPAPAQGPPSPSETRGPAMQMTNSSNSTAHPGPLLSGDSEPEEGGFGMSAQAYFENSE
jgi:hypothetical protein